ncbi:MAG: sugar phosphate isomerase/epimerase [Desulfobacterales bacterium]|nr:sugar phosphate isomerase/epimerase [Desulfobacterales bacterium]
MNPHSFVSGFTDEVSDDLGLQIKALKTLGWHHIDLRTVNGKNVSALSDEEFDLVHQQLTEDNIIIACFGSTIANWGRDAHISFEVDMAEMRQSIRHMQRSGVKFIRIMSYRVEEPVKLDSELESIILKNIKNIVRLAEDHGIVCLHENCETWGGQSADHSLRLLEQINSPSLKLVYDTGNPVSMMDVRGDEPFSYQDPLAFFKEVIDHVAYLHIKDAKWVDNTLHYTFPGEGDGKVKEILALILKHNMAIPISIEPHVAVVFHDPSIKASLEDRWTHFIDYGNQFVAMAKEAGISFNW